MSPAMAAAAAVTGKLTDVRKLGMGRQSAITSVTLETPAPPAPLVVSQASQPDTSSPPDPNDLESQSKGAPSTGGSATGGLPPFTVLTGIAAPLHRSNVDTDLIIPARFLKTIKRTGLGVALFDSVRYDPKTREENPDFILNKEPYRRSKILVVTGPNFGCGSSREHAPWALMDFGIRCIIAPSFGEIHENNLYKNGMLPISSLTTEQIALLASDAEAGKELTIDLPAQVVRRPNGEEIKFEIEEFRKHCLVNGLDDIGLTLQKVQEIERFEKIRSSRWPWLDGIGYRGKIPIDVGGAGSKKMDW